MSFRDWFVGHHTKWLETELEKRERDHRMHLEFLRLELATAEIRHATELADVKKTHAEELSRVIDTNAWLKDEIERLRTFLIPTMQPSYDRVRAANTDEPPPKISPEDQGTPWQRLVQRDLAEQDLQIAEEKRRRAAEAEAAKTETPVSAT
jgi:hypothetical protein